VPGIGEMYHIARVEPSHFDAATCYLAVDGHRLDDLKPYLFLTRDYGATWASIAGNLPPIGNLNVVREIQRTKTSYMPAQSSASIFRSMEAASGSGLCPGCLPCALMIY